MKERKRWDAILARLPKGPCKAAEIGVWDGKTSQRVLAAHPWVVLVMVDRWRPPAPEDSYYASGSETARRSGEQYRKARELAEQRTEMWREVGRARVIVEDSARSADLFPDDEFDLVFVDGDHSYAGCKRDVEAWWPKVKAGGWMGGHDYAHPGQGEVKRAVDEIFPAVEFDGNRTWWVRR